MATPNERYSRTQNYLHEVTGGWSTQRAHDWAVLARQNGISSSAGEVEGVGSEATGAESGRRDQRRAGIVAFRRPFVQQC